ncbi:hypothetical protein V6N13_078114 [Hibiscus sabdariffa]|uniref:Uncharacterized protein n=2 Tax=Hibiscus sabdariffa TaxID=183260 RepID=A0ABR2A9Y1_9ROSI
MLVCCSAATVVGVSAGSGSSAATFVPGIARTGAASVGAGTDLRSAIASCVQRRTGLRSTRMAVVRETRGTLLVEELHVTLQYFKGVQFKHVPRECNRVADRLCSYVSSVDFEVHVLERLTDDLD